MRKAFLLFFAWLFVQPIIAQQQPTLKNTFKLQHVLDSAMVHYPISKQTQLINQMSVMAKENLSANYLPVMQLNGQMSYQSDVTGLGSNLPSMNLPQISKDWYKVNFDVTQMIYDGGKVKQLKSVEDNSNNIRKMEVETHERSFKELLSKLYFRVLLLKQQEKVLTSSLNALQPTINDMKSAVTHGMVLATELKSLQAEYLRIEQQRIEVASGIDATLLLLSAYSGLPLKSSDSLVTPTLNVSENEFSNMRPEWALMMLQQDKTMLQKKVVQSNRLPVVQAFAQAGYGRPGYNMLDDDFTDYYMVGMRFNYKIWDWSVVAKEKQLLDLQAKVIETNKENFGINQNAAYAAQLVEIVKMNQLLENDKKIIELQQDIVANANAGLKNGTITAAAYLLELEKLTRTRMSFETNHIKLMNAQTELMFITGNISFND